MNLGAWQRLLTWLEREEYGEEYGGTLSERIEQARTYVDNRLYRADVVQQLPQNAPAGMLLVTPGDINLYVGTGGASPLRKIPTQAL